MDLSLLSDVFVTVLVIMDPLGSIPLFLGLRDQGRRATAGSTYA